MENQPQFYPLTHPQKIMWYIEKVHPNTSIGNVAGTLRIKGHIDFELLEKAINIFLSKNDGMRLRIVEQDGEPKQYISEYKERAFDFFDFSNSNEIEDLYKWDEQQTKIPFELIDSDLFYFALVKVNDTDGGIYAKIHHLISDAWTITLAGNQIMEYYTSLKNGFEISKESRTSYLEYIISESEYKNSNRYEKDNEYWNNRFDYSLELTTLKQRTSSVINTKARRKTLLAPIKFTKKLREYCLENKTSVFTLFLAALSMYINRVSSKEDIIIGTTTLNRVNAKEKETIGMFSNIVPIRVNIDGNMDFKTFSGVISKESMSLLRHQRYPYDLLLKQVREKHRILDNLFDIVLIYQNSKFNKDKYTEEYKTRWHFNGHRSESLCININDREDEGHLIIDYDYQTDLFNVKEIEFIHQHIISLLWHALDNPAKEICMLDMLSEREKHKILHEFNNTKIIYSEDKAVPKVLEGQAEGTKYYILDNNLNLLPIGIAGDLYILSENEINMPDLSQKAFADNPFEPGKKLYKTGDIARWYPKGDIEYLARRDSQRELALNKKTSKKEKQKEETQVKIAATFTSEPIGDYIKWWGSNFKYTLKIEFAGYNQVFQEFLNPSSILSKNQDGINVVLIRFEDFIRNDYGTEEQRILKLEQIYKELIEAINRFSNTTPLIMPIFPISTHLNLSFAVQKKISELNTSFEEILSKYKNIYTINLNDIQGLYSIEEVFDGLKDKEGHMPFTEEYYAAMATEIARKICAIKKQHFKVIVLDCDDTLWKGICGEQGALGVKVEEPYRELQEFMLQKYNEGMLLAVCSKNNTEDVLEVFDKNPDMVLSKKHIISWKVNWEEKSKNIRETANELNLGLDSFIYIDDSSLECSKMAAHCPEVLTLQLPKEEYIPMFLKHVWAFDRVKVTKEDSLRNNMYAAEQKRNEVKNTGLSLGEFIKNLELKVSMRLIQNSEIERAAQLTQRTNQFNLSTIRRTEQEITELIQDNKIKCFIIEASDKFGDYGIVGLVILKEESNRLFIDTFLLSCRILGRRVEDVVLSGIRRYAKEQGRNVIETVFIPTEKNKLILGFLANTKWDVTKKGVDSIEYSIAVNDLPQEIEHIEFYYDEVYNKNYQENENTIDKLNENEKRCKARKSIRIDRSDYNLCNIEMLEKINHKEYILPLKYFTGEKLLNLPINEEVGLRKSEYQAPTNEIEEKLTQIWEQILKIKMIGTDDDFFELGGDSLHAIQLQVNLLKYNWNLTTQDIYKYRTIRQLSNVIINMAKNDIENVTEDKEETIVVKNIKTKITSVSKKDVEYSNILLVGATGYLGVHILDELLTSSKSNVYCLVRAKTNNDAKGRLKKTLKFYFGDEYDSVIDKRVFAVSGDITLDYLGLKQNEYMQLQQKIDLAVHAGALVSYYGDYSKFEEINIRGTEKVVKFCLKDNKPLIYISTMGVSGQYLVTNKNANKVSIFTENDLYIGQNYFENPYVRSKYEAETLVNKYIKKGAKIAILRVGNLTGRFIDGHFQKNITQNAFYNIMKSIISIGAVSKNILNEIYDFTPVDYCSKAIVNLLKKNETIGRTFHLYNHNTINVSQMIELFEAIGLKIKCLEKDEFKQLIKKISSNKSSKSNLSGVINDFNEESQLSFHSSVKLDSEITVSYLKQLCFDWPLINTEYIQKIVNYMKHVKYISKDL